MSAAQQVTYEVPRSHPECERCQVAYQYRRLEHSQRTLSPIAWDLVWARLDREWETATSHPACGYCTAMHQEKVPSARRAGTRVWTWCALTSPTSRPTRDAREIFAGRARCALTASDGTIIIV